MKFRIERTSGKPIDDPLVVDGEHIELATIEDLIEWMWTERHNEVVIGVEGYTGIRRGRLDPPRLEIYDDYRE